MPNTYEAEALEALALTIIKEPQRRRELESHAREWVQAYSFYCEENEGIRARGGYIMSPESIASQVRGIDFNHPIRIGVVPPPRDLVQFQAPTIEGNLPKSAIGNYWTVPGQTPPQLGLSDYSKLRDPAMPWQAKPDAVNVKRTAYQFEPAQDAASVRALFSTAAPVIDNWSRRTSWNPGAQVVPIITPGGGQQIFSPSGKEIMNLKAGQEKQLTQAQKYEAAFARKYM